MCGRQIRERRRAGTAIKAARELVGNDRLVDLSRGLLDNLLFPLPCPQKVDCPMTRRLEQPGSEGARVAERAYPAVHRPPDFLLHVLCIVADEPSQVSERPRSELLQQLRKGGLVSGLASEHQEIEPGLLGTERPMLR